MSVLDNDFESLKRAGLRVPEHPLLLTGGSSHLSKTGILDLSTSNNFLNCSVDALTFTMPISSAMVLEKMTSFEYEGKASQGFKSTEARLIGGETCWRKVDPHCKSKKYGGDYESWEFTGASSHAAFDICRGLEGYPTRKDIATDYACASHETTCFLRDTMAPYSDKWSKAARQGKPNETTYYLPTWAGDRFFRVYRKDIRTPGYSEDYGTPFIMRFEAQLMGDWAKRAWNKAKALQYAEVSAWHGIELTDVRLWDKWAEPCKRDRAPVVSEAKTLHQQLKQYSSAIVTCDNAGIPIIELAHKMQNLKSKASKNKRLVKEKKLIDMGPKKVVREIMNLIGNEMFEKDSEKNAPNIETIRSMFGGSIGGESLDELFQKFRYLLDSDVEESESEL